MDDLISRQAAIEEIEAHMTAVLYDGVKYDEGVILGYAAAHRHIVDRIKLLPPAQPERKSGMWIVIEDSPDLTFDPCKCSECGAVEYFTKGWKKFSYCPNCGAEMEE